MSLSELVGQTHFFYKSDKCSRSFSSAPHRATIFGEHPHELSRRPHHGDRLRARHDQGGYHRRPNAAYRIDDIEYVQTPTAEYYLVELERGKQEVELRITAEGTIL